MVLFDFIDDDDPRQQRLRQVLLLVLLLQFVRCENLQGYDRISQYYFRPGEYDSEVDSDDG